jgi:serine/threonine-protein kinase
MGIVYLAQDESLQREVAVKAMLLPDDPADRAEQEHRFRQEATAAGAINHPNVITIHDLGREGDWLYIAMERLPGTELRELMTQGTLPLAESLAIAAQVANGLAAAHAHGVVHRDIKPSNIMVLPGGRAKIMDFGVARVQKSAVRTQTGVLLGSPKYMSPEQVAGHPADHRSDIFSLGSMLYEMAAGSPAFTGANLGELLSAILHSTPPAPSTLNPQVPAQLDAILERALEKNAQRRWQDGRELAEALEACRAGLEAESAAADLDLDLFDGTIAASAAVAAPVAAAAPGFLLPSPRFDSKAALRRMLSEADQARPARQWHTGWMLAFAVALTSAVLVAFG